MQGAVARRLGIADVVVKLARQRPPEAVHDPEGVVAVLRPLHEHAQGEQVVDLVERAPPLGIALHFLVDGINVFDASPHLGADLGRLQRRLQFALHLLEVALARRALRGQEFGQPLVFLRLQVAEGQVLQFPLKLPDAQARGQRGVDLHGLARDAELLLPRQRLQGAHVVEPIGEFDDHDPHVARHGHEHLAEVLRLFLQFARSLAGVGQTEVAQLRDTFDQVGDLGAEDFGERGVRDAAILDHVVEQRRLEGRHVELQIGHGDRRGQGMLNVGRPGDALVVPVRRFGVSVGPLHRGHLVVREVGRHGVAEVGQDGMRLVDTPGESLRGHTCIVRGGRVRVLGLRRASPLPRPPRPAGGASVLPYARLRWRR